MKTCTKCKIEKPFEAFSKNKKSKDGHAWECKECIKTRAKRLKQDPLMQLEKQIRSSIKLENKILSREGKKLCTRCKGVFLIEDLASEFICKECNRIQQRKYCEKNKENKEKIREHKRKYRDKNKEKAKEYRKEYYEKNKEILTQKKRDYRNKNKDRIKEYQKEYHRQYRLKKKLEKENKIDPKEISALMEKLNNIKE